MDMTAKTSWAPSGGWLEYDLKISPHLWDDRTRAKPEILTKFSVVEVPIRWWMLKYSFFIKFDINYSIFQMTKDVTSRDISFFVCQEGVETRRLSL